MVQHFLKKEALNKCISMGFYLILMVILLRLTVYLKIKVDFSSFYMSFKHLGVLDNPYAGYPLTFLDLTTKNAVNLNTPFFVMWLSPLAKMNYFYALSCWQVGSIFSLILGIKLTFNASKLSFHPYFLGVCFSYPILMNFFIAQIGAYIFF